ncbi:hypothetical protein NIES37_55850 [Tolypothrix tenuis PCC 7101]|uniref:DUF305 domain-containing protein n=1 Tax=Tolypothrix tenuis PCC 7101 TaxID=231146 RepID=A0A1Z4N7E3_9CYAN|nr:DUF305 domain-containing protein [Aulosira sp. FACHB-113]BAZ01582.1 hypothetical protein NIES37_55850 [Tolypothrix tenuis PCC 7101]BAZ74492.1 hypothetical protein NIES50_30670 [Aulosira laxa NIES-50]
MQFPNWKNSFLSFSLIAIASVSSSVVTACSQSTAQNHTNNDHQMNHDGMMHHGGGMNHSMAMDLGPADANYDLRFIDGMIVHHQGAIVMAKEAQQKSKRPEIKKLADDIIKAQNQEISQMKSWRTVWYPKAGAKPMAYDAQKGQMMEMSSEQMQAMMMNMDLGAADAEFDLRFIDAMIPHHEGAVTMAKDALQKTKRSDIKKLAQAIIKAQDAEINQMKQWRKAWYNK